MPKLAQEYDYYNLYEYNRNQYRYNNVRYINRTKRYDTNKKILKKKKFNPIKTLVSSIVVLAFMIFVMPFGFNHITKQIFNPTPYKNITTDLNVLAFPTIKYLHNSFFLNSNYFILSSESQMTEIKENVNMPALHSELVNLMELYPKLKPAIYVWDYQTGNYIDINASKKYSTASIIKIPVLIDLFRTIELGNVSLNDKMNLTEYYRTEGSGDIQFKAENSVWTIDKLARKMITISDNSATNMLIAKLGSMEAVNQSIRDWGLKNTALATWLPDLKGNNHTTARELGRMLYNIDTNEKFLSDNSRTKIFEYMGNVKNDRLIHAGLGAGSTFLHKTGDIGSMLGDAGIVITPTGKKYIVSILVKRPHNDPCAKEFIVKASEIIYRYMVK